MMRPTWDPQIPGTRESPRPLRPPVHTAATTHLPWQAHKGESRGVGGREDVLVERPHPVVLHTNDARALHKGEAVAIACNLGGVNNPVVGLTSGLRVENAGVGGRGRLATEGEAVAIA